MADKAQEFLAHAAKCRRLAMTVKSEEQRQPLLRIAEGWEELAREQQEKTAPPDDGIRPQDLTTENDL